MRSPRVCVFGAGGVGGFIAATLANAGCDVSVVARGAHLKKICSNGLTLETDRAVRTVRLPASDDPAQLGCQDLVIVTVKTSALRSVARTIQPLLGKETTIAFASNGIYWFYGDRPLPCGFIPDTSRLDPDNELHRGFDTSRSVGIIVRSPNEVVEPGVVRNRGGGRFIVGGIDAATGARAEMVAETLGSYGLQISKAPDIRVEMWKKLLGNVCSSLLCCLNGASISEVLGSPHMHAVGVAIMSEVAEIAERHGYGTLPGDIDEELQRQASISAKPSMLQDLERGRMLELDSQFLILKDFSAQLKIRMPTLDALIGLLLYRVERSVHFA